jgi:hypothetical protein
MEFNTTVYSVRHGSPLTAGAATGSRLLALSGIALVTLACGKKGPPLAPLTIVPQRVEEVTAHRRGEMVELSFAIPTRNSLGTSPADIQFVEVYALTGNPVDRTGRPLDDRGFIRNGTLVARVEVEPPPEAPEENADPAAPPADDPRPAQGERVFVSDTLTPAALTPFVSLERPARVTPFDGAEPPQPLAWPSDAAVLTRSYTAAAVSSRGRRGRLSERVVVPLTEVPPPATGPEVTYTATTATLAWSPPPTAHVSMFSVVAEGELPPRVILGGAIPHTYNVYAWDGGAPDSALRADLLNPDPIEVTTLALPALPFGTPRCFGVRVVERSGRVTMEGALSPPTCVTPVDAFPPEAPRGLAAVGSEGGISLIWDASAESDLVGYLVLRGTTPAAPDQELTPAPIKETTFRDVAAAQGTRFSYVVVSVDTAGNRSRPSNQVEDAAR